MTRPQDAAPRDETSADMHKCRHGAAPSPHTPGPWKVNSTAHRYNIVCVFGDTPERVLARCSGDNCLANARLIASAPDLLRERDDLRQEVEALRATNDAHFDVGIAKASALDDLRRERDELREALRDAEKALQRMISSHGEHGPCRGNACRDCDAAYQLANAASTRARAVLRPRPETAQVEEGPRDGR